MLAASSSPTSLLLPFLPTPKPYRICSRRHYHHRRLLPRRPLRLPLRRPGVLAAAAGGGRHVGIVIDADEVGDVGDRDLPVDLCFTRTLPPALTLADGHVALRRAVEEIKANPPRARSGVIRFQVLVPPSTKALKWLCCQCRGSSLFPQFYLLRKPGADPSFELDLLNYSFEVSGIGAVICVHGSSQTKNGYDMLSRYLSVDSPSIRAYGSIGMEYDKELSSIEQKRDSFYFIIPQVELNEFDGYSLLASTMVWDDSVSHSLENALCLFESCFEQMNIHDSPASFCAEDLSMDYIFGQSYLVDTRNAQMMYLNAEVLATVDAEARSMPKGCSNINFVWASLIVEECVRLGLTYFCIAPGSRSSPLAIAATVHPLTNCISCYDERSLGFHALGYGKASQKAAIVITSSGTAVSNLLPAVVEACQDFVPILLLTADRPPELQGAGANQAVDQVNHYGKFVRFFFNLPPPSDQISARMVLTTVDSAAYFATQAPQGPAHINCAFREPLEDSYQYWSYDCLRGLDKWFANIEPYTRYLRMKIPPAFGNYSCSVVEVLEVIQKAKLGVLLIGAIHTEDDVWAVAFLAKHLSWPVVADILSGLRLRKVLNSFPELEESFLFIDQMDQILLSDSVRSWICPDVVVQIGSRITSKRIGQFLESSLPSSYILVDAHPCRHDPSHIVTHRIESSIAEFAAGFCKSDLPKKAGSWRAILKLLNSVVLQEIIFHIHSECSLTEPHVAHVIGEVLHGDAIIFVGNSMVIRDLDMYGEGWVDHHTRKSNLMTHHCPDFLGIRVAGNRGASGIDGLLSTAIGFAVGSNKHVFCLIGDISFLHDTNGLSLLNQSTTRKPITVIVINNHGGAIFSLLPIAETTPPEILNKFFYTAHDISIAKLCAAHRMKHFLVQTKAELQDVLVKSHLEGTDSVVEVETCIDDNAKFHRLISLSSRCAATQALDFLLGTPYLLEADSMTFGRVRVMEYMLYRIQLSAPRTSGQFGSSLFHEGFILKLSMDDDCVGFGEVAPIEIHEEDLLDVEEQLRFLFHRMKCSHIDAFPLLKGSFSNWIWRSLGVHPTSIFPSVRCGLEMAILNALAAQRGSTLLEVLAGYSSLVRDKNTVADDCKSSASVQICALVDCNGTPVEVAHVVSELVADGFTTIKLKVGRRKSPIEDAAVIQKLRETVGYKINIRVDANQKWTYEQAIEFGSLVKSLRLQYIEDPVNSTVDVIKFCEDSGLPVALDETIDNIKGDLIHKLNQYAHPGIVAIVIKPSVIGGFENAAIVAKWAQMHGKMAVISSTFESSLGLSTYVQFAHHIDLQDAVLAKMKIKDPCGAVAHGLGTYQWLREDVSESNLKICTPTCGDGMEASVEDAHSFLQHFHVKKERIQRTYSQEQLRSSSMMVDGDDLSCLFKLQEIGNNTNEKIVLFLHGFLGTSEDWIPMMKAISSSAHAIAVDLPGHGESQILQHSVDNSKKEFPITVNSVADLLLKLICNITDGEVFLVGYSMGARIALHMALNHHHKINGAVIISGSPGLRDEASRRRRTAQDKSRAHFLLSYGLEYFVETWYSGKIWASLRSHPQFDSIVSKRAQHSDIQALAKALTGSSIGRQKPLWEDLKRLKKPLLIVAGENDQKFKEISQQMCREIRSTAIDENGGQELCELFIVPDCGHAVHLENPLPVIRAVRKFLAKLDQR